MPRIPVSPPRGGAYTPRFSEGLRFGGAGDAQLEFVETANGWQINVGDNADVFVTRIEFNTGDHADADDIIFYKGDGTTVSLRWDESDDQWEFIDVPLITNLTDGGNADALHVHAAGGGLGLTTKGDLHGYDTADARVPVGLEGEVLFVTAADAQGVLWRDIVEADISDLNHDHPDSDHNHDTLTGVDPDDHHAEVHTVASTGPHAQAGLTAGHVLRASAAAAFDFAALAHGDLSDAPTDAHHAEDHQARHQSGGADVLAGLLDATARTSVSKNSAADVGARRTLNFIEGTNITLTIADDAGGEEIDITIDAAAGAGSPLTTKGDIFGYDTADARIPVGTNGHVLFANSTPALGVEWRAIAEADISDLGVYVKADGSVALTALWDASNTIGDLTKLGVGIAGASIHGSLVADIRGRLGASAADNWFGVGVTGSGPYVRIGDLATADGWIDMGSDVANAGLHLRAKGTGVITMESPVAGIAHSELDDAPTDAHHAEVHTVASTGPHAQSGLTIGHVLRASGAAAFDFAALAHGDLSDAPADAHHPQSHTAASHSDQGATGAELETLTDGSNADALHSHAAGGGTADDIETLTGPDAADYWNVVEVDGGDSLVIRQRDDSAASFLERMEFVGKGTGLTNEGDWIVYDLDGVEIIRWDESVSQLKIAFETVIQGLVWGTQFRLLGGPDSSDQWQIVMNGSGDSMVLTQWDNSAVTNLDRFEIIGKGTAVTNEGDIIFYDLDGLELLRFDESQNVWELSKGIDFAANILFGLGEIRTSAGPDSGDYWQMSTTFGGDRWFFGQFDDSGAGLLNRMEFVGKGTSVTGEGDWLLFDLDGTVIIRWDESADRFEFLKDITIESNFELQFEPGPAASDFWYLEPTTSGDTWSIGQWDNSGATARERIRIYGWDAGTGTNGDILFLDGVGTTQTARWDESADRWEFTKDVNFSGTVTGLPAGDVIFADTFDGVDMSSGSVFDAVSHTETLAVGDIIYIDLIMLVYSDGAATLSCTIDLDDVSAWTNPGAGMTIDQGANANARVYIRIQDWWFVHATNSWSRMQDVTYWSTGTDRGPQSPHDLVGTGVYLRGHDLGSENITGSTIITVELDPSIETTYELYGSCVIRKTSST